ncbi:RNA-directed DNA polymerase, eukaryota, nucleotide-binding alpha-beta plait domain protein [Tanacetum coccineum]
MKVLKASYGVTTPQELRDMGDDVDINTLTMEQYLPLIQDNIRPSVVKPKIGDDSIRDRKSFPLLGITHDVVMLRVFPITLTGPDLRWKNRLLVGSITTWDLLKKEFIRQYCPPFKTAKKLKGIRNFKQEMDETLYHAWEDTMIFYTDVRSMI